MRKERTIVRCPLCKKETAWKDNPFRPFCSERCRMADLGKWASEEYRIAGKERPHDEQDGNNSGEG